VNPAPGCDALFFSSCPSGTVRTPSGHRKVNRMDTRTRRLLLRLLIGAGAVTLFLASLANGFTR